MESFTLMDMFPAFTGPEELDHRQINLLELCSRIGVPFPAERNKAYGNWWHSLHEIGHWAVKPDWYIHYSQYLIDDLHTIWGSLHIPSGMVKGIDRDIYLPKIGRYVGGNDVIPEAGLYVDPTPGEHETRVWSLQIIEMMGWNHPFDDNTSGVSRGNDFFHKPASARVWATPLIDNRIIRERMERWGLDIPNSKCRPEDDLFTLPYPTPVRHKEMVDNMDAIYQYCGERDLTSGEREYWLNFLKKRWPNSNLSERFMRIRPARSTTHTKK
jgi:hypothetical protein